MKKHLNKDRILKILFILFSLTLFISFFIRAGNMGMGAGNFNFHHIHINAGERGYCATVERWYDDANGIEVLTSEYGSLYCSEGTYILFETKRCPYCDRRNNVRPLEY